MSRPENPILGPSIFISQTDENNITKIIISSSGFGRKSIAHNMLIMSSLQSL